MKAPTTLAIALVLQAGAQQAVAQPGRLDETYEPPRCSDAELDRGLEHDEYLSHACLARLRRERDERRKRREEEEKADLPEWRYDGDSIEAYGFGLMGGGMAAHFRDFGLGTMPRVDMPDVLVDRNLRLHGIGWLAGGGARASYQSDGGFRVALSIGAYHLEGMELRHDELPSRVSVELGRASMLGTQFSLGKGFDAQVVYPYVDAVLLFNVIQVDVDVSVDELGGVGSAELAAFSFGLAPRLGVFIPVDGDFYFDFSGHWGLFGVERGGGQITFGIWDD